MLCLPRASPWHLPVKQVPRWTELRKALSWERSNQILLEASDFCVGIEGEGRRMNVYIAEPRKIQVNSVVRESSDWLFHLSSSGRSLTRRVGVRKQRGRRYHVHVKPPLDPWRKDLMTKIMIHPMAGPAMSGFTRLWSCCWNIFVLKLKVQHLALIPQDSTPRHALSKIVNKTRVWFVFFKR